MRSSLIPPDAQKVFSGVIFDVYHWEQQLFDGSTETFERLVRPDYVSIIPVINGQVVLASEQQPAHAPFTGLVGGRVEKDEESLAAAKRELREEAGLESDDWELFKVYHFDGKVVSDHHCFIAKNCRRVEQKQDAGEQIVLRECSFEEFLDVVEQEDFRIKEFALDVLRMRLHPELLEDFKKKLF